METTLIFHRGIDLPHFASFDLLATGEGRQALRDYYETYVSLARDRGVGLLLDTPTWRANRDWGDLLGYSEDALARVNRDAVALVSELRTEDGPPIVVSGCIGPRGDGYQAGALQTAEGAQGYHAAQVETFAGGVGHLPRLHPHHGHRGARRAGGLHHSRGRGPHGPAPARTPACPVRSVAAYPSREGGWEAVVRVRGRSLAQLPSGAP